MPANQQPDAVMGVAVQHTMELLRELSSMHPDHGSEWTEKLLGQILSETAYTRILASAVASAMGIRIQVGPPKPEIAIATLGVKERDVGRD